MSVQDEGDNPVPDAWVSVQLVLPDGSSLEMADWTGLDGVASFRERVTQPGRYDVTVSGVSKEGWSYDPAANLETFDFLIVP